MHYKSLAVVLSLISGLLLLTGCYHPVIPPTLPTDISPEQRHCAIRCINQQSRCLHQHMKIYQQCKMHARQQANVNYSAYVNQQQATKQKVKKTYNDFLDLSHCNQQLNCNADYATCYQQCNL